MLTTNLCRLLYLTVFLLWESHCHANPSEPQLATLSFKVLQFQNHQLRRLDGTCCGEREGNSTATTPHTSPTAVTNTCTTQCSLEFRVCLEPFGLEVSLTRVDPYTGPCVYGQAWTGHWGNTDTTYAVHEAPTHPIAITTAWPRSFSAILEAYDLNTSGKKRLIDRAVHRGLLRPVVNALDTTQGHPTEWHHVTTSTQYSGYTLTMRLACQPDRYNNTCTKICLKNSSRYTCDSNGDRMCELGWSGSDCDKASCQVGCDPVHGSCTQPGECDCTLGWQGPYCDECIKYPGCKHGTCDAAPYTCRCLPEWGGKFCDQDLDYCGRHGPCRNGGICKNTNSSMKPFNCSCPRGYTGDVCETKLPACSWNPCKRGRCVPDGEDHYKCACEPGWRGDHCEENIDYCLQNSCLNGGTCQDLDGVGFRCLCPRGFEGANCQLRSPCSNSRCVHARDCTRLHQPSADGIDYACVCQPGWTGQFCDKNVDDCMDKCQNGGKCHDLVDDFYCTCPVGFYGRHCEINRECANNPCENSGICHEIKGGYRCECPDGFTGHNCEIVTSSCNPNPCQNAAYCYTLPHGFYCKCSSQHYGQFCEHKRPYCGPDGCAAFLDPCFVREQIIVDYSGNTSNHTMLELDPSLTSHKMAWTGDVCGAHGTCLSSPNGTYQCACSSGFQGRYCQERVNYCETNPCLHGGTCVNGLDQFECLCEEGFVGAQCETPIDLCQPNPCQHGGYCQHTLHPGDFECRCAPSWSGRWCQLRTPNPCDASTMCFNHGVCERDPLQPGGFRCECNPKWMGTVCHLRRPEARACANHSLCRHGATCVDVGDSFNCICLPGFDGQFCENDINECNSMPCHNNGTCHDLVDTFECDCPKGFIGKDCRININECATNPCAYGATCIDRVGNYECICPEGRHGLNCEEVYTYQPPKPPSCNFQDRLYDHNETWTYNCQQCQCNMGQVICQDDFCGYWSCFRAVGESDRFACKTGEVCHILPTGLEGECFVAPCYLRTACLNASTSIDKQLRQLLPHQFPGLAVPGCRPNAAHLNNRCARIQLHFVKQRVPYGVTVGDVCNAIRQLPLVLELRDKPQHAKGLGLSCDIMAGLPNWIEVTLSSNDDQLTVGLDGKDYSFVHRLTHNISQAIAIKAATNLTTGTDLDESNILPPLIQLLGTERVHLYWHQMMLGVVEINVETKVVEEKEIDSPILLPLICVAIVVFALICAMAICAYGQRKYRDLLFKYAPSITPNNEPLPKQAKQLHTKVTSHRLVNNAPALHSYSNQPGQMRFKRTINRPVNTGGATTNTTGQLRNAPHVLI